MVFQLQFKLTVSIQTCNSGLLEGVRQKQEAKHALIVVPVKFLLITCIQLCFSVGHRATNHGSVMSELPGN